MVGNFNVGEEVVAGIKDVFSTMLMVDLEHDEVLENQSCAIQSSLTSILGFGGEVSGMLAIHCPAKTAKGIVSAFLGEEKEELDEDVKDAIGEIANMVAGNLKVSYAKNNITVELALPTSIVGESFQVSGAMTGANRLVVPLIMDGDKFWLELIYAAKESRNGFMPFSD